jgi:hypothetical protein
MSKPITIKADVFGGAGAAFIDIGKKGIDISSSSEEVIELEKGHYKINVTGSAPAHGSISITLLDGDEVLDEVVFTQPVFMEFLDFEIK